MSFLSSPFYVQQIIVILFILALFLSILSIFLSILFCKKAGLITLSSISLILSFILVFLSMRGCYLYQMEEEVFEPSYSFLKLPLWVFLLFVMFLFLLLILEFVYFFFWRKKNLSPLSIKESFDTLPMGICFYEDNGLIRLSNTEMDDASFLLDKEALLNGSTFYERLEKKEIPDVTYLSISPQEVILQKDEKVLSFRHYLHQIEKKDIHEIDESDITKTYELTKELEKKTKELQRLQKRLLSYEKNVKELITEREILETKIHIHGNLGKLLLITKEKMKQNLSHSEKEELLLLWEKGIDDFLTNEKEEKKDGLQVLEETARRIGIEIIFQGKRFEKDSKEEKILLHAIHESLTNAVKHAQAKTLFVTLKKENLHDIIEIRNDGILPKKEILEGGGLSSLRKLVEENLGKMEIVSKDAFLLRIIL